MSSYLVVGASRGIGLEYVLQLAKRPDAVVIALVRNPAKSTHLTTAIAGLMNVHVVAGDVTDYRTLELASKQVGEITGGKLDYLIHNAANLDLSTFFKGFDDYTDVEQLDSDFIDAFKVNSLGPVHSIRAFLPLLRASSTKKIVVISTAGALPEFARHIGIAGTAAYSMTKAAGLLATTKYAVQLKDEGFVVVSLNPGLVNTTATAVNDSASTAAAIQGIETFQRKANSSGYVLKTLTPEESVLAQLKVIDALTPSNNGLLLDYTGGEVKTPN